MRRNDRLYRLIQILRDGRVHQARDMARTTGVSERTIYRDMDILVASGVPVLGERGLGYRMTAPVTLPPLNLTLAELEALHLGLAAVAGGGDEDLREAARSLSAQIDAALPEDRSGPSAGWGFAVYPFADAAAGFRHMPTIRSAIRARQKLAVESDETSGRRVIRPLKLDYWGRVWTVTCWCETRSDFATLRIDRIDRLTVLPALFIEEKGKSLADFQPGPTG